MTRKKVCQACNCGGAGSCSSGCQFDHLCGKDVSKEIKEALKLIEDKFNDVPGNMPIVATGTPMIEVYRIVSDLLKKREKAIIEECGKVAWAGDDGFYVKFSDIKTIIATLNTK